MRSSVGYETPTWVTSSVSRDVLKSDHNINLSVSSSDRTANIVRLHLGYPSQPGKLTNVGHAWTLERGSSSCPNLIHWRSCAPRMPER